MIFDKMKNWEYYPFGSEWKLVFEFLKTLTADSDEKKYCIQGDDIFAQVRRYNTLSPESAVLETHREYVDIHATLIGSERVDCFSREGIIVDTPYDESKDVEFYKYSSSCVASVNLFPGNFVMLLPHEAHMPSLMTSKTQELVKKVVVKVKIDLLT